MIDSSVDSDFAAFERQESLKEVRPSETDAAPRIYHGKLAALRCTTTATPTATTATAATPAAAPPDPLGHLRAARLGFAAVAVLVIYWLWIRRKA